MTERTSNKPASSRTSRVSGKRTAPPAAPQKLKVLVTIVGRSKADFYVDLLQSTGINYQQVMLGQGTASTETLQLLGLSNSDKAVIFSVLREDRAKETLSLLSEKFSTVRGGKGIAYTIPMTSIVGATIYRFLCDNRMPVKEGQ